MEKYEKRQVERDVLVEHTCDICGQDVRTPKRFDFSKARIKASIGSIYPDHANQIHYNLDLCKNCFMNKVKPLIENTFDVEFQETED